MGIIHLNSASDVSSDDKCYDAEDALTHESCPQRSCTCPRAQTSRAYSIVPARLEFLSAERRLNFLRQITNFREYLWLFVFQFFGEFCQYIIWSKAYEKSDRNTALPEPIYTESQDNVNPFPIGSRILGLHSVTNGNKDFIFTDCKDDNLEWTGE